MILGHELILDAITKKRPVGKLFKSAVRTSLDDYFVSDYVTTDNIPKIILDGNPAKLDPRSFFEKHQYRMPIKIDGILKKFNYVKGYQTQKKFAFDFVAHFFDTFIVIEIMPNSLEAEFIVLSPPNKFDDDNFAEGLMASTSIMAFLHGLTGEPGAQVALYMKVDQLLEYLRTGLGRKKRFGIF